MIHSKNDISVIGTVGLPAKYGGFETLAENLVLNCEQLTFTVYCSKKQYVERPVAWRNAELVYIPLDANGVQSVLYDALSICHAIFFRRSKNLLVLGVSGAIFIPIVRLLSNARVVTNIDGLEWRRDKWNSLAKSFLKFSEYLAVKFSHDVISDNQAISEYVSEQYNKPSTVIAYGGDHVITQPSTPTNDIELPADFYFTVCRIEKENNIHLILEAFSGQSDSHVVFVGNWNNSSYGRDLFSRYSEHPFIHLLNPIYDLGVLRWIRESAIGYLHGHSAGGTNPSLVEAMWFGKPIFAFDCSYNKYTTHNLASYFKDAKELSDVLDDFKAGNNSMGEQLLALAQDKYKWSAIANQYVAVFNKAD